MKNQILFSVLSWVFLHFLLFANSIQHNRALVISGGQGGGIAGHIAIIDAFEDAGLPFDVVVSSCGASISSAIFNLAKTKEERLELLLSPHMHQWFSTFDLEQASLPQFFKRVSWIHYQHKIAQKWKPIVPDIFQFYLIDASSMNNFNFLMREKFDQDFQSENNPHKVVMLASELLFNRQDQNKKTAPKQKLFRETYFTDSYTAELLKNHPSFPGVKFPQSFVSSETATITDAPIFHAFMSSIADPYYFHPHIYQGRAFTTGAMNHYPLTVAKKVAKEVWSVSIRAWDPILEQPTLGIVFHYQPQALSQLAKKTPGVNFLPPLTKDPNDTLAPMAAFRRTLNPNRSLYLKSGIPKSHRDYQMKVMRTYKSVYQQVKTFLQ